MRAIGLAFGAAFGFLLAAAGFSDPRVINDMLLLRDAAPYLIMGSAVAVAAATLWLLERWGWRTPLGGPLTLTRSRVERHHLTGGAVFGVGWALAGTCPAPVLAMAASGAGLALVVIAGLFSGLALRGAVQARGETVRRPAGAAEDLGAGAPARGAVGAN